MAVTRSTLVEGYVLEAPESLAIQAGVDLNVYSLARSIYSEHASGSRLEKVAIGSAILNESRHRRVDVTTLLTTDDHRYGSQRRVGFASTARDPGREDVEIARAVLRGEEEDPTGGARRFFSPAGQDRYYARGVPGYEHDATEVLRIRTREGWTPIAIAGIDPQELLFFVKGRLAGLSPRGRLALAATTILAAVGTALLWTLRRG